MMELSAQLVLCGLDSRQQLLDTSIITHGQHQRSTVSLLVGRAGAQNVCMVTLFKSPRPVDPSLSTLLSSHGGRSNGRNRCSSSVRKRLPTNANPLDEAQTIEELWEEYFADPLQWWDNRVDKSNPRSPDFKHKVTRKALWVDGWSNPPWVKAMIKLGTQDKPQFHGCTEFMHKSQGKICRPSGPPSTASRDTLVKIEKLWEEYFARPSEWCDNRATKTNPRYPDFTHKHTREGLWVGDLRNPPWVKQQLNAASGDTTNSDDQSPLDGRIEFERVPMGNNGEGNTLPSRARESRQIVQGGGGSMHVQSTSTTSEAIAILKNRLQQGILINSYTYVDVLKRCSKQKDLLAVKQVHDCIMKSGMDQNAYVGTTLLSVYIRCGRLQDARRVFDGLLKKDVFSWTVMIGGYAQRNRAEDAMEVFHQMRQENVEANEITYVNILKACARPSALKWGKEVHAYIRQGGLESDARVGTALLLMYAKCGCIKEARETFDTLTNRNVFSWNVMIGAYVQSGSIDVAQLLFDSMKERDVVTWNLMIGGLARHGCGEEAYRLLLQMKREGFKPNAVTFLSILNACASAGALEWVKEVHGHAQEAGLESEVRVGSALVHMYAKSGSMDDARLVFDRMEERNVITWNVMIGAYAESGCGEEAYRLFLQMECEGFKPNAITYVSILNVCASAGALEWVKAVHGHAQDAGLESEVRVGSALVHMYAKSGSMDDARLVFDRMEERNVITWTVMIGAYAESGCGEEAYRLFLQMECEGFKPNAITYVSILNACASAGALEWVKAVHGHAQEAGLESEVRVGSALVHMYAKSGSMDDARLVFDRMEERHVIAWNVMIGAYAESGCGEEAYRLFLQMEREGFKPNAVTYVSILNACASAGALEWVKAVHGHAQEAGLESEVRVGSALVHMYAKSGSMDDARLVFDRMEERDVIAWNVMIGAYAESGCGEEAYRLFLQMECEGFKPNAITYVSILNACASAGALEWVKAVHGHAQEAGLESEVRVGSALVHMYAKSGSMDDARLVFDRMEERNVITWTVMIGAYAESGCGEEAYRLFLQMEREGFKPNAITYVSILNACASAGALEWVKAVHGHAQEAGLESEVRVGSALVHMYAKSGSMDDARLVFDRMEERNVITWTVMIGGLAQHGCALEALELLGRMSANGFKPNGFSFLAALSACSHAGLVFDGRRLFLAMTQDFGIKADISLCNCMVDLLGRAGQLEEAMVFIGSMPVEPDGATWGAFLGACRTYGNVELAEVAAKERLKLDPSDASTYVLLSNIYAAAGKWDQVSVVRTMMQKSGIRKEPGRSWIEVDNKIHRFVVGDTSHPETKEIYAELKSLTERIKAEGYIPDTRLVLRNVDEEDKELALCSHSEKLAIAYGLIRTARGKPLRVFKNLRICSDCHTATKFISKVTGREIVARDANRFHHFNGGVCSCGDYW